LPNVRGYVRATSAIPLLLDSLRVGVFGQPRRAESLLKVLNTSIAYYVGG
jgi:hypothetical protein